MDGSLDGNPEDSALTELIARLELDESVESSVSSQQIAEELQALKAIYGDDALKLQGLSRSPSPSSAASTEQNEHSGRDDDLGVTTVLDNWKPGEKIRFNLFTTLPLPHPNDEISMHLSITLPPGYPSSPSPPQLQLLSRYIGSHGVDAGLFGEILRTYISSEAVDRRAGDVCVFEGVEWARERVGAWWEKRRQEEERRGVERAVQVADEKEARAAAASSRLPSGSTSARSAGGTVTQFTSRDDNPPLALVIPSESPSPSPQIVIVSAPALVDRKSTFVGHAARINDPSDVPCVLNQLLSDRRIARATHPVMHAWVCEGKGGVVHKDNDDDGESAAGGRLAHLLQLLEVMNVIVVVTRWYGGIHLGPDRFKLINRAGRDALELGEFIPGTGAGSGQDGGGTGKKRATGKK